MGDLPSEGPPLGVGQGRAGGPGVRHVPQERGRPLRAEGGQRLPVRREFREPDLPGVASVERAGGARGRGRRRNRRGVLRGWGGALLDGTGRRVREAEDEVASQGGVGQVLARVGADDPVVVARENGDVREDVLRRRRRDDVVRLSREHGEGDGAGPLGDLGGAHDVTHDDPAGFRDLLVERPQVPFLRIAPEQSPPERRPHWVPLLGQAKSTARRIRARSLPRPSPSIRARQYWMTSPP